MPLTPVLLALHVLSIVYWIGGVAFVTITLLPALSRLPARERFGMFTDIERRFGIQARVLVVIAGSTGYGLLVRMRLTGLLSRGAGWWLDGMIGLWALFAILLFVLEPLLLHRKLTDLARRDHEHAYALLLRGHRALLILATLVIFGAILGANGVT